MRHLTEAWRRTAAKAPPNRLYHFTSLMHLDRIVDSGALNTTESNIEISGAGPRVVWLTSTTDAGGNGLSMGFKDQVRITVLSGTLAGSLHWWPEWSRAQGIEDYWYDALESASGGGKGSADNWWVVTKPIPSTAWLNVEQQVTPGSWKSLVGR